MRGDLGPMRRVGWIQIGAGFAVLAGLVGATIALLGTDDRLGTHDHSPTREALRGPATSALPSGQFSPAEQRILGLLPAGYTAGGCTRATDPFPNAVASLDCRQAVTSDNPSYARFTLYDDLDALTGDFQSTADDMAVAPCPGGNASLPGTWYYSSDPGQVGGKVVCGIIEDRPNIAWTRDAQLLLATVNGGPDLDSLYQWWQGYGSLLDQKQH